MDGMDGAWTGARTDVMHDVWTGRTYNAQTNGTYDAWRGAMYDAWTGAMTDVSYDVLTVGDFTGFS